MKLTGTIATAGMVVFLSGCSAVREPPNLFVQKQALIRYHDEGPYAAEIERIAREASGFLRERVRSGQPNLALVLDIDDTALSTWDRLIAHDFARKDEMFVQWFSANHGPAIAPILSLYREARQLGIAVFFVTGRALDVGPQTEANLRAIGYSDYAGIYFRPKPDPNRSAVPFKSGARREIAGKGFTIIANIGDQQSDLDGGFAERTFKLPNPFYFSF